jgi:hypothetical protein
VNCGRDDQATANPPRRLLIRLPQAGYGRGTGDRAVDYVALVRFRNNDYLDGYWQWRTWDTASTAPMRTLPCADGRAGRDTWLHGEYLCYVSDDGLALLRWTDERTATYGVMNGVAGRQDLTRLYRAWAELAGMSEGLPQPDVSA